MSEIQSEKKQEISNGQGIKSANSEKSGDEHVRQVVTQVIQSEFSGPLPPPNIIKRYEDILPGAADRILSMAENQAKHRQEIEKKMIDSEARDGLLGVCFAFILGISCIIAGIIIAFLVPQSSGAIAGSIFGVAGIGSIIATFIKGTRTAKTKDDLS